MDRTQLLLIGQILTSLVRVGIMHEQKNGQCQTAFIEAEQSPYWIAITITHLTLKRLVLNRESTWVAT